MTLKILHVPSGVSKVVLVMLCGLGGTADGFASEHAVRIPGVLVVALDYTNHATIDAMAASVWTQLDAAGIRLPAILLGYSMGGFVAQAAACIEPWRVLGVILVSTAVLTLEDMYAALTAMPPRLLAALTWSKPGSQSYDDAKARLLFSSKWLAEHQRIHLGARMRAVSAPRSVFLAEVRAVIAHAIANEDGRSAACVRNFPVLVLHGSQDVLFPAAVTIPRYQRVLPTANIQIFGGSGHALITEQTERFSKEVTQWIYNTFA
jgi:pimeloyl-ACP methyl ester carboxylesterase